jgi:hypothetical protein
MLAAVGITYNGTKPRTGRDGISDRKSSVYVDGTLAGEDVSSRERNTLRRNTREEERFAQITTIETSAVDAKGNNIYNLPELPKVITEIRVGETKWDTPQMAKTKAEQKAKEAHERILRNTRRARSVEKIIASPWRIAPHEVTSIKDGKTITVTIPGSPLYDQWMESVKTIGYKIVNLEGATLFFGLKVEVDEWLRTFFDMGGSKKDIKAIKAPKKF